MSECVSVVRAYVSECGSVRTFVCLGVSLCACECMCLHRQAVSRQGHCLEFLTDDAVLPVGGL